MKPNQILAGLACLMAAAPAFSADVTSITWQFATDANPVEITPAAAVNPYGAKGTLEITPGTGTGHWSGTMLENPAYGTATGLWDILAGSVDVGIDKIPAAEADYTLTMKQFVSPGGLFPYALNVSFSLLGTPDASNSTVIESTSLGQWVESTYEWHNLTANEGLSLTISTTPGAGLLLDSLAIEVTGILIPIPEPTVAQLGGLGLAALGFLSLRRGSRK